MADRPLRRQGYTRIIPEPHPEAVAWWYVHDFGDGFVFARGGRITTSRKARSAIHQAQILARIDHQEWRNRPRVYKQETAARIMEDVIAGSGFGLR